MIACFVFVIKDSIRWYRQKCSHSDGNDCKYHHYYSLTGVADDEYVGSADDVSICGVPHSSHSL